MAPPLRATKLLKQAKSMVCFCSLEYIGQNDLGEVTIEPIGPEPEQAGPSYESVEMEIQVEHFIINLLLPNKTML